MKKLILIIIVFLVIGFGVFLLIGKAPEDIERVDISNLENMDIENLETSGDVITDYDISKLKFTFTGYGPGKSHDGTFDEISVSDVQIDGKNLINGKITFQTNSINTGIEKLDADLCKENFFDCQNYPEISYELKGTIQQGNITRVFGLLTMKNISKNIAFEIKDNDGQFEADFVLDVNQFGFNAPNIVDNEVRIKFNTTI